MWIPHMASPDSRVRGANMGPIWGRQDRGGPHVGPMNLVIWGVQIDKFTECIIRNMWPKIKFLLHPFHVNSSYGFYIQMKLYLYINYIYKCVYF